MPEGVQIIVTSQTGEAVAGLERTTGALDQLSASARRAAAQMEAASAKTGASSKRAAAESTVAADATAARWTSAGKKMESVGRGLTRNVTLPIVAVGAAAAKFSLDFHESMVKISTQAGGTEREVRRMTAAVEGFAASGKTIFGPNDLAQGLFHLESLGLRGAKAMRALHAASDLAAVGGTDLESTVNAVGGAMQTGIKGASNMRHAVGLLNATVGAGNLRMQDLNAAMGTGFLTSAKQVGLSLKDVGAALASLTAQGIPAAQAATRLRMTFTLMAAPTSKAKAALQGIGLGASDLAKTMRSQGLVPALAELRSHLEGLSKIQQTQVLSEAFGGARSGTTIMALVNNLGDVDKRLQSIGQHAGEFNQKLAQTKADPAFKLKAAWAQAQVALVKLGDELVPVIVPALQDLASTVSDVVKFFDGLPGPVKSVAVDFGIFAAALGPAVSLIGKFVRAGGAMLGMDMAGWFGEAATAEAGFAAGLTAIAGPLAAMGIAAAGARAGIDKLTGGGTDAFRTRIAQGIINGFEGIVNSAEHMSRVERSLLISRIRMWESSGKVSRQQANSIIDRIKAISSAEDDLRSTQKSFGIAAAIKKEHGLTVPIIGQIKHELASLPPAARKQGAELLIGLTRNMENRKELPVGVARNIRALVNAEWPKMKVAATKQSAQLAINVSRNIANLGSTLTTIYQVIVGNTNAALKAFKAHPVSFASQAIGVASAIAGTVTGKARGGYLPGSGRQDTVPVMAAPGEAFLNRHQQPPVEAALAASRAMGVQPYGSLGELFSREQRPHYAAKGGKVPDFRVLGGGGMSPSFRQGAQHGEHWVHDAAVKYLRKHGHGPYQWPFRLISGYGDGRTDMGFDSTGAGPIVAMGDGRIIQTGAPGWPGGGGWVLQLDRTPPQAPSPKSDTVYQYEHLRAKVASGQKVKAGQVLGTQLAGFPFQETGWALSGSGTPIAASVYSEGDVTAPGRSMTTFLAGLKNQHARGGFVGKVQRMASGGWIDKYNHSYAPHKAPDYSGEQLPPYVIAAIAESAGLPGWTFEKITEGESNRRPGAIGDDQAAGYGNTFGYGLWQLTSGPDGKGYPNGAIIQRYGGWKQMMNPVANALAAKDLFSSSGFGAWAGHLTGNSHYSGVLPKVDLHKVLAGGSGAAGSTGPTAAQKQAKADRAKLRKHRKKSLAGLWDTVAHAPDQQTRLYALQQLAAFYTSYGVFDKDEKRHIGSLRKRVTTANAGTDIGRQISAYSDLVHYERGHASISGASAEQIAKDAEKRRMHHRQQILTGLQTDLSKANTPQERLAGLQAIAGFWSKFGIFSAAEEKQMKQYQGAITRATATPEIKDDIRAYRALVNYEDTFGKISGKTITGGGKGKGTDPGTEDPGTEDTSGDEISRLQQLLDLTTEQLRISQQNLAISQGQSGVIPAWLRDTLPFAGAFGSGGIVPGPVGKPYSAIVHGGEAFGGLGGGNVQVYVSGSVAPLLDVAVQRSAAAANKSIGRGRRVQSTAPGF